MSTGGLSHSTDFFFSSRRRHTRWNCDWSSDVCSSDLGRWASGHGVSIAEGHRAGSRALRPVVETAIDLGIESLAVYAFSTENWSRSPDEVEALMEIFGDTIDRELPDLAKQGVRTRFVGRRDRAPDWLQSKMADLEQATASESRLKLWIAFDYGGRAEIVE